MCQINAKCVKNRSAKCVKSRSANCVNRINAKCVKLTSYAKCVKHNTLNVSNLRDPLSGKMSYAIWKITVIGSTSLKLIFLCTRMRHLLG